MSNESSLHKIIKTKEQADAFMKALNELSDPSVSGAEYRKLYASYQESVALNKALNDEIDQLKRFPDQLATALRDIIKLFRPDDPIWAQPARDVLEAGEKALASYNNEN